MKQARHLTALVAVLAADAPTAQELPMRNRERVDEMFAEIATRSAPDFWTVHVDRPYPEGSRLIEGDIIVSEQQLAASKGPHAATYGGTLWPNNVCVYDFDANMQPHSVQTVLDAMADWEALTGLVFVPRDQHENWIHIRNSSSDLTPSCSSAIGMTGGMQTLNLSNGCLGSFTVHHELAHALGTYHEQSRTDRDGYVSINWCNIEGSSSCGPNIDGAAFNFQTIPISEHFGPYDFDSVMHYRWDAFADCQAVLGCGASCPSPEFFCTTIDVLPAYIEYEAVIGQRDHLSLWDGLVMSFQYPESDWRFFDPSGSGAADGSFEAPYHGTLQQAIQSTPDDGELIVLSSASFPAMTLADPITIRVPDGTLTLQ